MGLPGHRRTSSHKRRRASHFALRALPIVKDKTTQITHLMHKAAPGATEYNGVKLHVKGSDRKLKKMLKSAKDKLVATDNK